MVRFAKILVPTDFSECSRQAVRFAVDLAKVHGAEVILMHVLEPKAYPGTFGIGPLNMPDLERQLLEASKQSLERVRGAEIPADVPCKAVMGEGSPYLEIVRAAEEQGADLIVIATHGYSGIKHMFLGSTAERVVRKATCPVLTVRATEE